MKKIKSKVKESTVSTTETKVTNTETNVSDTQDNVSIVTPEIPTYVPENDTNAAEKSEVTSYVFTPVAYSLAGDPDWGGESLNLDY